MLQLIKATFNLNGAIPTPTLLNADYIKRIDILPNSDPPRFKAVDIENKRYDIVTDESGDLCSAMEFFFCEEETEE